METTRAAEFQPTPQVKDPLANLVEPLHDLVFQHLSGRDVINLFAVSPYWNETVMQSSKAMSKIVIRCYDGSNPKEDPLPKSRRSYQNADLWTGSGGTWERKIFLIKKLAPELKELELSFRFHPSLQSKDQLPSDIKFPLLKKLSIGVCMSSPEAHNLIAGTSEHLKKLSFTGVNDLFHVAVPSIKGKLISFSFPGYLEGKQKLGNFSSFLMEMSSTLQILRIDNCSPEIFEFIITKMTALKILKVMEFKFEEAPTKARNQSITNLVYFGYDFKSKNTLKCIPNLETIRIPFGEEVFKTVLEQTKDNKKVKRIEVGCYGTESPHTIYQELMMSDAEFPRDIEIIDECEIFNCIKL